MSDVSSAWNTQDPTWVTCRRCEIWSKRRVVGARSDASYMSSVRDLIRATCRRCEISRELRVVGARSDPSDVSSVRDLTWTTCHRCEEAEEFRAITEKPFSFCAPLSFTVDVLPQEPLTTHRHRRSITYRYLSLKINTNQTETSLNHSTVCFIRFIHTCDNGNLHIPLTPQTAIRQNIIRSDHRSPSGLTCV